MAEEHPTGVFVAIIVMPFLQTMRHLHYDCLAQVYWEGATTGDIRLIRYYPSELETCDYCAGTLALPRGA